MRNYQMEVLDAELVHGETEAHIDGWCHTEKKKKKKKAVAACMEGLRDKHGVFIWASRHSQQSTDSFCGAEMKTIKTDKTSTWRLPSN